MHVCQRRREGRLAAFSTQQILLLLLSSSQPGQPTAVHTMALSWVSAPCSSTCSTYLRLSNPWAGSSTAGFDGNRRRPHLRMRVCHDDEARARAPACPLGEENQQQSLSRGAVLRHAASSLVVGAAALGAIGAPAAALDPQRDARTAQPPPPALLLPVMRLRVRSVWIIRCQRV